MRSLIDALKQYVECALKNNGFKRMLSSIQAIPAAPVAPKRSVTAPRPKFKSRQKAESASKAPIPSKQTRLQSSRRTDFRNENELNGVDMLPASPNNRKDRNSSFSHSSSSISVGMLNPFFLYVIYFATNCIMMIAEPYRFWALSYAVLFKFRK
jgi:hypothetical protein